VIVDNYNREIKVKILYWGPTGSGKTTNLLHLSKLGRIEPTLMLDRSGSTVYFDLLIVEEEWRNYKIIYTIFASCGQDYYAPLRKLIMEKVDFVVFVLDSKKGRLEENVASFNELISLVGSDVPILIQANKRDLEDKLSLDEIKDAIGDNYSVIEAIAIDGVGVNETFSTVRDSVKLMLSTLLKGRDNL